jgi:hypothetical protein
MEGLTLLCISACKYRQLVDAVSHIIANVYYKSVKVCITTDSPSSTISVMPYDVSCCIFGTFGCNHWQCPVNWLTHRTEPLCLHQLTLHLTTRKFDWIRVALGERLVNSPGSPRWFHLMETQTNLYINSFLPFVDNQ